MQLYSAYIYEANSSLLLNSETRIVIYYVIASSGHVLASSLELWLLRYDDLLYFAWFVQRANKSSVYNRNNTPSLKSGTRILSSILLWSRNMFRCFLELSTSWEIVIFHLEIFTQNDRLSSQVTHHVPLLSVGHQKPTFEPMWKNNTQKE